MKSAMSIWEAMEKKARLREEVKKLVHEFADSTGLDVSVNVDSEHDKGKAHTHADIQVSLPK